VAPDGNGNLVPDCDLRNPNANGFGGDTCGPMANKNFGQQVFSTTADPNWIQGRGKRPYSWAWSVSLDHQLASGVHVVVALKATPEIGLLLLRPEGEAINCLDVMVEASQ